MNLLPGTIVRIANLSKPSYYLYRAYLKYSPLLICPCRFRKRDHLFTVEDTFENGVVLLKSRSRSLLTMTYSTDLELIYEKETQ